MPLILKLAKHTHTELHLPLDNTSTMYQRVQQSSTDTHSHQPAQHASCSPDARQLQRHMPAHHLPYPRRHMLWCEEVSQLESGHWHLTPVISTTAVRTHRWLLLSVCICVWVCCLPRLVAARNPEQWDSLSQGRDCWGLQYMGERGTWVSGDTGLTLGYFFTLKPYVIYIVEGKALPGRQMETIEIY